MKKLALVAGVMALVMLMSFSASAQGKMYLNVGADALLPLGSFSDAVSVGFGGTVKFEYAFLPELNGTFTSGYLLWSGKDEMPNSYGIPFMVGAKYFFTPGGKAKPRIYGSFDLGLMIYGIGSKTYTYNYGAGSYTVESPSASETDFAIAPAVGAEFPISSAGVLDVSARYLLITSTGSASNIGVRLGYKFPLN